MAYEPGRLSGLPLDLGGVMCWSVRWWRSLHHVVHGTMTPGYYKRPAIAAAVLDLKPSLGSVS